MYKVYTRETPARPWLGVVAAAVALALTLGAAWLMTKQRYAPLAMERAASPPAWPMSFSIPQGWVAEGEESTDEKTARFQDQLSYQGRDSEGRRIRAMVLFRTFPSGLTARQAAMRLLAGELLRDQLTMADAAEARPSVQAMGPLYGEKVRWYGENPRTGRVNYGLVAAACLPSGVTIGVIVHGAGELSGDAYSALRSICGSIAIPGEAATASALKVQAPASAWAVPSNRREIPSIDLTAGADAVMAWHIRVRPTFLMAGRTIDDLMHDHLVNDVEFKPRPASTIRKETVGGYSCVVARPQIDGMAESIRFVDLTQGRAALVVGLADPDNGDELDAMCSAVAASLSADTVHWPFNVEKAAARGERLVAAVRAHGIDGLLPTDSKSLAWAVEQAGERIGLERAGLSYDSSEELAFRGAIETATNANGVSFELSRSWAIGANATSFESTEKWSVTAGAKRIRAVADQRHAAEDPHIDYRIRINSERSEGKLPLTGLAVPDPLLDGITARIARELEGGDALLAVVTLSDRQLAGQYVQPLAEPAASPATDVRAMIVLDCNPVPMVRQYDRHGYLRRADYGDGRSLRRIKTGDAAPPRRMRSTRSDEADTL